MADPSHLQHESPTFRCVSLTAALTVALAFSSSMCLASNLEAVVASCTLSLPLAASMSSLGSHIESQPTLIVQSPKPLLCLLSPPSQKVQLKWEVVAIHKASDMLASLPTPGELKTYCWDAGFALASRPLCRLGIASYRSSRPVQIPIFGS